MDIRGSRFFDNAAPIGGAIGAYYGSNIRDCIFSRNEAESWGGAISFGGSNTAHTVEDSTFIDNSALDSTGVIFGSGGAIFFSGSDSRLSVSGSTFSGNTAEDLGGAIAVSDLAVRNTNGFVDLRSTTAPSMGTPPCSAVPSRWYWS